MSAFPAVAASVAAASAAAPAVDRVAGADRFDGSVKISQQLYKNGAPVVYIATGANYPDALSAGAAAAHDGGPLLLTHGGSLPSCVRTEIQRLKPAKIVVVGGTASVSSDVLRELGKIQPNTVRIGGADRFEASRNLVDYAFGASGADTAYVATGADFPDALSAGGAAGVQKAPVLLVNGRADAVDSTSLALLRRLGVAHIKIVGGTKSVSGSIEKQLAATHKVSRLSGDDRFESSLTVNRDAFSTAGRVFLATGHNFPDALAGSAWAGNVRAPLFVVPKGCVPRDILTSITNLGATRVTVLGGLASLSPNVDELKACAPVEPVVAGSVPSSALSFGVAAPNSSAKKVFAHYFPPYPISLDNKAAESDYYARNYLSPSGEKNKFIAVGGLLRDRPEPRDPVAGNWQVADLVTEIRQASDAGIDGFTVNIMSWSGRNWETTVNLMKAAEQSGRDFTVVPNLDASSGAVNASVDAVAAKLAELYRYPGAYRLSNGEYVLSSFKAEGKSPAWWGSLKSVLQTKYGMKTAFIAVLLDSAEKNQRAFAPISYAIGDWGTRNPEGIYNRPNRAAIAHSLGVKWISGVGPQDVRPNQKLFAEARNTETLRAAWTRSISDGADMVQLVTWNDYSEGTTIAPSVGHGSSFLDISAYYATRFKSGSSPKIVRDSVYVTHRTQFVDAKPSFVHQLMKSTLGGSKTKPVDMVEVLTFLTAPAKVTVTAGSTSKTFDAPAGVFTATMPLALGEVKAVAVRGGQTIAKVDSPYAVVASPRVQDLQYHAESSRID